MADERFTVVQGEVIQPLFTPEDATLVETMAARCANTLVVLGGTPEELGMASGEIDHLASLADRIQQWLDQQAVVMSIRDGMADMKAGRVKPFDPFVIDDTNLTEG